MTSTKEILIVIDMLKGFIIEGPLADPSIKAIIPENVKLVQTFLTQNKPVLSFQDSHSVDALEFDNYPPHCLKGTLESEMIDELLPFESKMLKIEKNTTNGFFAPAFQKFLKENSDLNEITVIGCCTDICILNFALTMKTYAQTHQKEMMIRVPANAVDTFDLPHHSKELFHKTALEMMKGAGILIV